MDRRAVIEGLDALCRAARARMPDGGAEIDYMTSDERAEMYRLKSLLPTAGEEAAAARLRIFIKRNPLNQPE